MLTPKNITIILISTIIVFYFTTDEKSKLFNTHVWPIKKSERINKAISYNIIDHERDITLIDPYSITHISHGIILFLMKRFATQSLSLWAREYACPYIQTSFTSTHI